MSEPIAIVHEDDSCVVVYKPPGLLVHRTRLDAGENEALVQRLRDQLGYFVYPVHRLDKPTAGLTLLAKSADDAATYSMAFRDGLAEKHYLAIVRGWVHGEGVVDYPLLPEVVGRTRRKPVVHQDAVTHFRVLEHFELPVPVGRYQSARFSLIDLRPLTGRRHQLRRHMAHLRHPIIGDTRHGDGVQNRYFEDRWGVRRLMLVAVSLSLPEAGKSSKLDLKVEPDPHFCEILAGIRSGTPNLD